MNTAAQANQMCVSEKDQGAYKSTTGGVYRAFIRALLSASLLPICAPARITKVAPAMDVLRSW